MRVVILRGEGRLFCAGADLGTDAFAEAGAGRAQRQMAMQKLYSGVVRAMRACPQPIIALIHGAACGGGFSLALASDVRYAAPNVAHERGLYPASASAAATWAPAICCRAWSASPTRPSFCSPAVSSTPSARCGWASSARSSPEDKLLETGLALAADMLKTAPMGLRMTKETLNAEIDAPSLDAALTMEDRQQVILLRPPTIARR